jgi:hypothetical protein
VLAGEPVRHVLWHDPEGSAADSSFMLLKHVDGHDEDDFAPLCFDCGLDLVPDGRALDVARERGEWHACEWEAPAL